MNDADLPLPVPKPVPSGGNVTDSGMRRLIRLGADGLATDHHRLTGDGWQPPSVEDLQRLLPQYEITAFIARGGMGAVYKGVQRSLEREVAIKVLPPELEDEDPQYATRFKHEAQAMARLVHPNIVAVHEAGEVELGETGRRGVEETGREKTLLYFVMEFIEGTDVAQLIASEGQIEPKRAVQITCAVCDALAFAHAEGIIHRDIKPSNIMIDRKGRVKVADFGLAKVMSLEGEPLTGTGLAVGTRDFAAPETWAAGVAVDRRADLYALGVMLYQMLTGEVPRGRFEPPSQLSPGVDQGFDAIVDRAMQTDREKRYSTAVEMREDVERVFQLVPGSARAGRTSWSRMRDRFTVLALASVLVVGFSGWWMLKRPQAPATKNGVVGNNTPPATAPWHLPDGEPGLVKELVGHNGSIGGVAVLPDGGQLLSLCNMSVNDKAHGELILWDVVSGTPVWRREMSDEEGALDAPIVILPKLDQAVVLRRDRDCALDFLSLKNGRTVNLVSNLVPEKPASPRSKMEASPDGSKLAVVVGSTQPGSRAPVYLKVYDMADYHLIGEWQAGSQAKGLYGMSWLDKERVIIGFNDADETKRVRQVVVNTSNKESLPQSVKWEANIDHYFAVVPGTDSRVVIHGEGKLRLFDVDAQEKIKSWELPGATTQKNILFLDSIHFLGLTETGPPRTLRLWSLDTDAVEWELTDERLNTAIALSPDRRFAVTNQVDDAADAVKPNRSRKIAIWRLPKTKSAPIKTSSATGPHWSRMPTEEEKKLAFTNTLGMKFVPVPGTEVLFCVHETRKGDYAAYAAATPGVHEAWRTPTVFYGQPVSPADDHPVVMVNLPDAEAFCAWLSMKEGRKYRLPTDHEWSCAVGLGEREDAKALPANKSGRNAGVFAWGTEWPPPKGAGNIGDETCRKLTGAAPMTTGYDDGFATTSPVMSFPPNALGLHDLAGNVFERVPDSFDGKSREVVGRGSCFNNGGDSPGEAYVTASVRNGVPPDRRQQNYGFRIVAEKP